MLYDLSNQQTPVAVIEDLMTEDTYILPADENEVYAFLNELIGSKIGGTGIPLALEASTWSETAPIGDVFECDEFIMKLCTEYIADD